MRVLMFLLVVMASTAPQISSAIALNCAGASAYYHYSIFTGRIMSAVSDACADRLTNPVCSRFLAGFVQNGDLLSKGDMDEITGFLDYLKQECPEDIPDNPGKFK